MRITKVPKGKIDDAHPNLNAALINVDDEVVGRILDWETHSDLTDAKVTLFQAERNPYGPPWTENDPFPHRLAFALAVEDLIPASGMERDHLIVFEPGARAHEYIGRCRCGRNFALTAEDEITRNMKAEEIIARHQAELGLTPAPPRSTPRK